MPIKDPVAGAAWHATYYARNKEQWDVYAANRDPVAKKRSAVKYRGAHKRERVIYDALRYQTNKEEITAQLNAWAEANPVAAAASAKRSRDKHRRKYPEVDRAQNKKSKQKHAGRVNAATARRRADKREATCKWANEFFIAEAYRLAQLRTKATGVKWHVDHIIPLKSKLVCGLHNEFNLRVIPAADNLKKHNRYWPDMP